MRVALIALLLWVSVGCRPVDVVTDATDTSLWGAVWTVAEAPLVNAPAIHATHEQVMLGWVGSDVAGVHHDVVALGETGRSERTVLPLPPRAPRDSALYPAAGARRHLLWLDIADGDGRTAQLYSAVIEDTLEVFRGPLPVGEDGALCYDALPTLDGGLWALWNDGDATNPTLHSGFIDPTGLVLRTQPLVNTTGCPVVIAGLEDDYVLWAADNRLRLATFLNGRLVGVRAITSTPVLSSGDRVRAITAGADETTLHVFWNVSGADGRSTVWTAGGAGTASAWTEPRPLSLTAGDTPAVAETTYNTGSADSATLGDGIAVRWAAPLRGPTNVMPVAVVTDDGVLGVLYYAEGDAVAYQRLMTVGTLLAPPALRTDRDRHLYLAWSEVTPGGPARLRLTSTKALGGG
ncbi:MAG: hypothetical protein AAF125_05300 [Chloroflexota bacterium]